MSTPVTGKLQLLTAAAEGKNDAAQKAEDCIACVITGVSVGLLSNDGPIFQPDNLSRLVDGEQCIKAISGRYEDIFRVLFYFYICKGCTIFEWTHHLFEHFFKSSNTVERPLC